MPDGHDAGARRPGRARFHTGGDIGIVGLQAGPRTDGLVTLVDLGFEPGPATPVLTEESRLSSGGWKLVFVRAAMGTRVSIAALHPSRSRIEQAIGEAWDEMDRLIELLSRYDERSALSELNDAGELRLPPPELEHLLKASLAAHRLSEGAFDVTVKPLVDFLERSSSVAKGLAPEAGEWSSALELVDMESVRLADRRIAFQREGMGVTLDGLAKGFIVDQVAETLEAHGVRRYLVDAGGDLRACGTREDGEPWTVGVRDPRTAGILPGALRLTWGAVATSGGYEARFDAGGVWHHVVSPRTGRSPNSSLGVTVQAPHALAADALATMLLLMPPRDGARLLESLPGFEGLVIDADGRRRPSSGWREAALTSEEGER